MATEAIVPDFTAELTDPVETTETSEYTEPTEGDTDPAETTETPETKPAAQQEFRGAVVDGNKLSDQARAAIESIKATDPRLAGEIRTALFERDALRRVFPEGGIKAAREAAAFIQEVGGREGFTGVKQELEQWHEFDQRFVAGDPSVVRQMVESNPESFIKIAPEVFNEYARQFPGGFTNYVSNIFAGDMQNAQLPLYLMRLQDLVQANPQAMEALGQIKQYVDRVNALARQKPELPKFEQAKPDEQFDQRERDLTTREFQSTLDSARKDVVSAEWSRILGGRKLSQAQTSAVADLLNSRLASALSKIPGHQAKVDQYVAQKNRQGYEQYMRSLYRQHVPKILRSAVDSVVPGKPGPKPGAPAAAVPAKPMAGGPRPGAQPGKAIHKPGIPPDKTKIKLGFGGTTTAMIRERKAILLDGTQYTW